LFDFTARPFGAIYMAVYVLVGIVTAIVMWKNGTGN